LHATSEASERSASAAVRRRALKRRGVKVIIDFERLSTPLPTRWPGAPLRRP
jgi:hypothetical protein